ncbi:MAG TPA: MotA/TolQ/ExbB proton channel family protein [Candidatus Acidoferrum sp.]|nr:MotA/TolQ/ExbB proton channel family protein [Candidatus Acidoferrum sp.]
MGGWHVLELWRSMGTLCHGVVIILAIMFVRAMSVAAGRAMRYRSARTQSLAYIAKTADPFREGRLEQAVVLAEQNRKSHIASVVAAGLLDFQATPEGMPEQHVIEGVRRSLERSSAETTEEMKRGLSGIATIAATAPFVGLFGTVIGILNAFRNIDATQATSIRVIAGPISEALLTTAIGLSVAVPAVWCYNLLTTQMDLFGVEMQNCALELLSYLRARQSGFHRDLNTGRMAAIE